MPTKPTVQKLNANSVDIVNAVRASATPAYQSAVPLANGTIESIREIGKIINSYQPFQNEFLKALVNRIGMVLVTSKMYDNPWARFKRGMMEYGETVEEIFVNIASPHTFDPAVAEKEVFKREIPDVRATFHYMNYQKFYKTTISQEQLKQAFLGWDGVTDLIGRIVDSLYTSANYDEFLVMKYLIAKNAIEGNLYPVNIPAVGAANAKTIVSDIKGISNNLEFMSSSYNAANVFTYSNKGRQILILNAAFDAVIDVEVLASAFNMDKAEFMGQRVLVDDFSNFDNVRLTELLGDNPNFSAFTTAEITLLKSIPAVLVDEDWFMIFDNLIEFTENYNGEGLYWNYWLHTWKIFSTSPFANAILFTTGTPAVTAVAVTPATATMAKGSSMTFKATVTATGLASQAVTWEITGATSSTTTINGNGMLSIGTDEESDSIVVTATSVYTPTVSGTATVTVS